MVATLQVSAARTAVQRPADISETLAYARNPFSFVVTLTGTDTFAALLSARLVLREYPHPATDTPLAEVIWSTPSGTSHTFDFTDAQMNQLAGEDGTTYWAILTVIDPTDGTIVLWRGKLTLVPSYATEDTAPAPATTTKLTLAEANAIFDALDARVTALEDGGTEVWGGITGTLSSQTDLNTALGLKANTASLGTLATQSGTFSGSGTLATGGFTLTVPATGTAALAGTYSNSALNATTIGATTPGTGAFTTLTLGTSGILSGGTNLIEQRNGSSAQAFRLYNTYTDASNYERATFGYTSNILRIGTENAGTGTARAINFVIGGTATWEHSAAGHFRPLIDNTYDIGASGATRPRNVFVAGNGTFGGTLTTSVAGAASTPAVSVTGAPYTAGTATTNHPLIYANGGTAPTTWNTAGTYLGVNTVSGFAGNFIDCHVNGGSSVFKVGSSGTVTIGTTTFSNNALSFNGDTAFGRASAGVFSGPGLSLSGTLTTSVAGAASTPAVSVTGAPYTAGTGTTNHPLIYANGGTAPTTWSTAGTYFGINAVSGFAGNLIDLRVNGGASAFRVSSGGAVTCAAITASGVFVATPNTLTGVGAIGVSTSCTGYISTGGAQALTLADGVNGQIKTIIHTSAGGSGVLTPTSKAGYTTITFANVGDSVTLQFITGTGWCITGIFGAVAA